MALLAMDLFWGQLARAVDNWQLLLALVLLCAPTATFLVTSLISYYQSVSKSAGSEPPLNPYWIPFLGSWVTFPTKKQEWFKLARRTLSAPITVKMGPMRMYMIPEPKLYASLLKDGRIRANDFISLATMELMFGTPKQGMRIFRNDDSGSGRTPAPGTNVPPHLRIWSQTLAVSHQYLAGDQLHRLGQRVIEGLSTELARTDPSDPVDSGDWTPVNDFFRWYTRRLYAAALTALCGPHLLRLSPGFVDDFWEYLEYWPTLASRVPSLLSRGVRRGQAARGKVLEGIKVWHAHARQHSDYRGDKYEDWDEYWGSAVMKARHKVGRAAGMDDDTLASYDMSFIVASSGNSLPAAFWNLAEIYADPVLLERVRHELAKTQLPQGDGQDPPSDGPSPPPRFDLAGVTSSPLLQSIYAETMRLRVSFLHCRVPRHGDYPLGPYNLRKGGLILVSSDLASHNETAWGPRRCRRPLEEFWADRFLVPEEGEKQEKEEMRFSMDGLDGAWIPYGGGKLMCPGRHLAKQEMIVSVAVFATYFDVELLDGVPPMSQGYFGVGLQPPAGPVRARLRRKVGAVQPRGKKA